MSPPPPNPVSDLPRKFKAVLRSDGSRLKYEVLRDSSTRKRYLLCERCHSYISYPDPSCSTFKSHWGGNTCTRLEKARLQREINDEADRALVELKLVAPSKETMPGAATTGTLPPSSPPLYVSDPDTCTDENDEASSIPELSLYLAARDLGGGALSLVVDIHDSTRTEPAIEPGTSLESDKEAMRELHNPCKGVIVVWVPGSVWESYAYGQHEEEKFAWTPVRIFRIVLRSKSCKGQLDSEKEKKSFTCIFCDALLASRLLRTCMERAIEVKPHTPHKYLTTEQLIDAIVEARKVNKRVLSQNTALKRRIARLEVQIDDRRRVLMKISTNDIPGAARALELSLARGDSPTVISEKLDKIISGLYRPHGNWTDREYDIAFLVKALGGPLLLYTMQKSHHLPSESTLRRHKKLPKLSVSTDTPTDSEIQESITQLLGDFGRLPPSILGLGMNLMIDGIALEEVPRYDMERNVVLGLCREHSTGQKKVMESFEEDLKPLKQGLIDGNLHYGKDGTVFALAPISAETHYHPTPVLLSGSCKAEKGEGITELVKRFIQIYNAHPMGRDKHGPILQLSTDGEASFRSMRFMTGLGKDLSSSEQSNVMKILGQLTGLNLQSGKNGLIGSCDPKHVFKRLAQMTRSRQLTMQIWETTINSVDIRTALSHSGLSTQRIDQLLNPADKQNVPIALNLLRELQNICLEPQSASPSELLCFKRIKFFGLVASYFTEPFTNFNLSISEQMKKLSTYLHLIFALYRHHKGSFIGSATYADSVSILKCIFITVARLQDLDRNLKFYIFFTGTDRLEGVFSHVRTQDHARNFDILQLSQRLVIGAEINRIYETHPDLYRGHVRRNMENIEGVDYINPASWKGEVTVGSVDLVKVFSMGRDDATAILRQEFGEEGVVDWELVFSDEGDSIDFMRPYGQYVGSRVADHDHLDLIVEVDNSPSESPEAAANIHDPVGPTQGSLSVLTETDANEIHGLELEQSMTLDPNTHLPHSKFFQIDGKQYYKSSIVPKYLISDAARKVTMRPFRNAGMTMRSIMERKHKPWATMHSSSSSDAEASIVNKDLGTILVRNGDAICVAVLEVLNFKTSTGRVVFDVKRSELDHVTVVGQVIELELQSDEASDGLSKWIWNHRWIPITNSLPNAPLSSQDFVVTVPGSQFSIVSAEVYSSADVHTWMLPQDTLEKSVGLLWALLEPESDAILAKIEDLPLVTSKRLPYSSGGQIYFCVDSAQIPCQFTKLSGTDSVECPQCGIVLKLRMLRNHVGKHILLSLRGISELGLKEGIKIGPNPCGWCGGSGGCKTQLKKGTQGRYTVLSNCRYHYTKMIYSKAAEYSVSQPCTNVPIPCSLCLAKSEERSQIPTFWKYNLIYHMIERHLSEDDGTLPPFPPDMLVLCHISRAEEQDLGVPLETTATYRNQNSLPGSDDIGRIEEELKRDRSASTSAQMPPSKRNRVKANV